MPARDGVGVDSLVEESKPVCEVVLPERHSPLGQRVAAPDVVDQDVEPSLIPSDPVDQRAHFLGDGVIDAHGNG